jgi:hypothetical protein
MRIFIKDLLIIVRNHKSCECPTVRDNEVHVDGKIKLKNINGHRCCGGDCCCCCC